MTAPRGVTTIDDSLKSFRAAGFKDRVTVCAEPGSPAPSDPDCTVQPNKKRLGNAANWRNALRTGYRSLPLTDFIAVMQDDIEWAIGSRDVLHAEMTRMGKMAKRAGYLSLYLYEKHLIEHTDGTTTRWRNWHISNYGHRSAGAQCYIVPRPAARLLLNNRAFNDQCDAGYLGDDRVVSGCLFALGLHCWFRVPGLVSHALGVGNSAMRHKPPADVSWQREATLYGV